MNQYEKLTGSLPCEQDKVSDYKQSLARLIKSEGLRIEVNSNTERGTLSYNKASIYYNRLKIKIGGVMNEENNLFGVVIILHELGHWRDFKRFNNFWEYNDSMHILELETRAWELAFDIAKEIGLTEFDEMAEGALQCLYTYYSPFSKFSWQEVYERILNKCNMSKEAVAV